MRTLFSKRHWWKVLTVCLLLYVFTLGLLIPLKSGLIQMSPETASAGDTVTFSLLGYNTEFDAASKIDVYLKLDANHYLKSETVLVSSARKVQAAFIFPDTFPQLEDKSTFLTTILTMDHGDPMILPEAIRVKPESISYAPSSEAWISGIEVLGSEEKLTFPYRNILAETIRNLFFHVPLWFGMIIILLVSVIYSIRYLRTFHLNDDILARSFAEIGTLFGVLGLLTGALWAKYTWGSYWNWDIKQTVSAIALLIYFAYFILRSSLEDGAQRAKLSSVYNIFAFAALIPLLFVIPRLASVGVSLHPGNGGNPGFNSYDLDATMRLVFYPAVIGWTLLGVWMALVRARFLKLMEKWRSSLY